MMLATSLPRQDCPEALPGIDARTHEPHDWFDLDGVEFRCWGLAD